MAKKLELDKPNRRTIETLFRDLRHLPYHGSELQKLTDTMKELEKKLLAKSPEYRALKKKKSAAEKSHRIRRDAIDDKVRKVRNLYLVQGLTPDVLKQIEGVVKEFNAAL